MYEDAHLEAAYEDRWEVEEYQDEWSPMEDEDEDYECAGCGERASGEMGEFFNPDNGDEEFGVYHVSCRPAGWEVS